MKKTKMKHNLHILQAMEIRFLLSFYYLQFFITSLFFYVLYMCVCVCVCTLSLSEECGEIFMTFHFILTIPILECKKKEGKENKISEKKFVMLKFIIANIHVKKKMFHPSLLSENFAI